MRNRCYTLLLLACLLLPPVLLPKMPRGCNNCWLKLGRLTENLILTIRENREKEGFEVDMSAITSAIDRSGLEERVSAAGLPASLGAESETV